MTDVKTWHEKLYEEIIKDKEVTKEIADKFFDAYWKFPASDFIDFHLQQLPAKENLEQDDAASLWREMSSSALELYVGVENKDFEKTVIAAYCLGTAMGKLQKHIDSDILDYCFRAAEEKDRSVQHFRDKEVAYSTLREMTHILAQREWKKDIAKELRVGEMIHIVWNRLVDSVHGHPEGEKHLPDRGAEGLRKWVREVAPDYARRGGRPKTK